MSNIYDMSGKKKVVFTEEIKVPNLSYKDIMLFIIKNATEEACHQIFCDGGVNLCPSEVFGGIIDKQKEEDFCNYQSLGCTKCWANTIELLEMEKNNDTENK